MLFLRARPSSFLLTLFFLCTLRLPHILAERMQAHLDFIAGEYRDNVTVRMPAFSAGYDIVYRVFDGLPQALYANLFCRRIAQIRNGLRPICVAVPHRHASNRVEYFWECAICVVVLSREMRDTPADIVCERVKRTGGVL